MRSRALATGTKLTLVDGLCSQIGSLTPASRWETTTIGLSQNPLGSISSALAGRCIETLHLVAHGRAGAIQLGGVWIDAAYLTKNASQLISWRVQRIAIWSCELGQDSFFASVLAELTGAQVWTTTGMLRGGDSWRLSTLGETAAEEDSPETPFTAEAIGNWKHNLSKGDHRGSSKNNDRNNSSSGDDDDDDDSAGGENSGGKKDNGNEILFPEDKFTPPTDTNPEDPIRIVTPAGTPLEEDSFDVKRKPDGTITIKLRDADPQTPGNQGFGDIVDPFTPGDNSTTGDGNYRVFIGEKELGSIKVKTRNLSGSRKQSCLEAIFRESGKSPFTSSSKTKDNRFDGDRLTGIGNKSPQANPVSNRPDALLSTTHAQSSLAWIAINNERDLGKLHLNGAEDYYQLSGKTIHQGEAGYILSRHGDPVAFLNGDDRIIASLRSDLF